MTDNDARKQGLGGEVIGMFGSLLNRGFLCQD